MIWIALQWVLFFAGLAFVCKKLNDPCKLRNTLFVAGLFLLLPSLFRVAFFFFHWAECSQLTLWQTAQAFLWGLSFDLSILASWGGVFILLLNLPVRSVGWQKGVLACAMLVLGVYGLLLVGDWAYFETVHRHTGVDILNLFSSFSLVWLVAKNQYAWALACVAAGIVALVAAGIQFAAKSGRPTPSKPLWNLLYLIMWAWLLFSCFCGNYLQPLRFSPRLGYTQNLWLGHVAQNGVFAMQYVLLPTAKRERHFSAVQPALSEITLDQALTTVRKLLLASPSEKAVSPEYPLLRRRTKFNLDARGRNLIILAFESLEWDKVDALAGTQLGATPNLDRLIKRGVVFPNFYSCGNGNSMSGLGTLMTGVCRISGLPYFGQGLEDSVVSRLGELFTKEGYAAWFVRPSKDGWMFINSLSRLTGFTSFAGEDMKPLLKYKEKGVVSDYEGFMLFADVLEKSPQPFFGFFFTLGTHEPWGTFVPESFGSGLEKKFPEKSYLRGLYYSDWALGQFLRRLQQAGLYEDTIFIIVGDHRVRNRAHASLQQSFHVPFVIVAPGLLEPGENLRLGGQADVLPTLVDMFHLHTPYAAMGNSLFEPGAEEFAFICYDSGDHFGWIDRRGLVLEAPALVPGFQQDMQPERQKALALNKALYELLQDGAWVPVGGTLKK